MLLTSDGLRTLWSLCRKESKNIVWTILRFLVTSPFSTSESKQRPDISWLITCLSPVSKFPGEIQQALVLVSPEFCEQWQVGGLHKYLLSPCRCEFGGKGKSGFREIQQKCLPPRGTPSMRECDPVSWQLVLSPLTALCGVLKLGPHLAGVSHPQTALLLTKMVTL